MTYIRPSWFAWLSWIGTSCAVLIVTFGIVRGLLQPAYDSRDIPGVPPHTPLADSNTLLQDTSHNETIPTPIVMSKTEVTPSPPHTEPTREIAYTTHHNQKSIQVETPTGSEENLSNDDLYSPILGTNSSMLGVRSDTPTVDMPGLMESQSVEGNRGDIDTEIQDMIWEINSILTQAGSREKPMIPDYPISMPIYIKESLFSPEETVLLSGSEITSMIMPTYTPIELDSLIRDKGKNIEITGTPKVRYIPYKKGNQSILVPTAIYTTTSGATLEVPLIVGY